MKRKLFYIFLILVTATFFVPACGDETKPASGKNLVSLEITLNAPGSVELHSLDDITADPVTASSDADLKILAEEIPHGLYTAYLTPDDLEKFERGEMSIRVQARDPKVNPGGITRVNFDFQEKGGNVEPWAKLKVTVRLKGGSLANGAVVEAGSTPENKAACTTDATGVCEFEVVPNETNSVEVTLDGYQMGFLKDGVIVSPFSTVHVAITLVPVSGAQPGDIVLQDDVYRLAGLPATLVTFKYDDDMKPEIEITSEVLYYLNDEDIPLATNEMTVPAVGECATVKVVWSNGKNDKNDPDDEFQVCGI